MSKHQQLMHYGRRLIHFQENILWHWIQMIYLFTLQRQFFLCCVYTHIDLDWPGFSFVYLYIITTAKQPIVSWNLVDRVDKLLRNITECLIKLKIDRRVSKYFMQIDLKNWHHKSLTLCYDDVQGHMIGHIHKQTQCG